MSDLAAGAVTVRPARPSDAAEIARLAGQLGYQIDGPAVASRLSSIVSRREHRFLVGELEGRIVGWIHAVVWTFVETGEFAVIGGLVVRAAGGDSSRALLSTPK